MKSHSFNLLFVALLCLWTPNVSFAEPAPAEEEPAPAEEEKAEEPAPAEEKAEEPAPAEEKAEEPAPAEEIEATAESVHMLVEAIHSKNWALAMGIILSMLMAFANKFGLKDKIGSKAIPWVTSGIAVLGAVGAALMGGIPVFEAVSQGLIAGVAAIGGWEMILKHLLASKKSEPAAE